MKIKYFILFIIIISLFTSCKKDFLDKKPDRLQLVPEKLADFQAILDNGSLFNTSPGLQETTSDDFFTTTQGLSTFTELQLKAYIWSPEMFFGLQYIADWSVPYQQVFTANIVLEGLAKISDGRQQSQDFKSAIGTALFYRSFAFYSLSQLFAKPYQVETASQLPGVSLRLVSDIHASPKRATLQQTYDQILTDLNKALELLPEEVAYKSRPSKQAVLALLARIYLSMEDYNNAGKYADQVLQKKSTLLDYNDITGNATARLFPNALPNGNPEVIFYKGLVTYNYPYNNILAGVNLILYDAYANDDLRKTLFFRDRGNQIFTFRGTYGGVLNPGFFGGLAIDELFLIRAECAARSGNVVAAIKDLNTLLIKRWRSGSYIPYNTIDAEMALRMVLLERRKELVARGLRWSDLRRLNHDPRFKIDLERTYMGQKYFLKANDDRYTFPIPPDEILISHLEQNP